MLRSVGELDGIGEGVSAGMRAGERDVAAGVPVLGKQDVVEARSDGVNGRDDVGGAGHGESSTGHEVDLHVDDEQGVVRRERGEG